MGGPGGGDFDGLSARHPGVVVTWAFRMLIAAVDPVAEAKLDGLDHAVTWGHYLEQDAAARTLTDSNGNSIVAVPVLASASSGLDGYASTQVQELAGPAMPPLLGQLG